MTGQDIEEIIKKQLSCDVIKITGDGRHWFGIIVSADFESLRALQRHQRVYACLGDKLHNDEIHALSMKTFTPAEWAVQDQQQLLS